MTTSIHVSTNIHVSPHAHIRATLNDKFIAMQNFNMPVTTKEQPYGIPTSMMAGLQNNSSIFSDNVIPFTPYNANIPSTSSVPGRNATQALTTYSMMSLRKQMDESNHVMVNMLTKQIGTIFYPLIQNTNQSYQALATQMRRIVDLFALVQLVHQYIPLVQNLRPLQIVEPVLQRQQPMPQPQLVEPVVQVQQRVILVNRNNDADEVVRNVQHQNLGEHNNISNLVETVMAQNGLNIDLHRLNFAN